MAKNAMRLAPPLLLAGALASQSAAAQVLDTRFGFSGLKVQAWSLADGSAVDAGVHFSSAHVFGEILNTRTGESVYDISSAYPNWNPVLAAAATHGSLSGGAVTGMLGDSLLLLHLDRADYPWRYADADMGSVAYFDLAPHSYVTVSGDWQFDYRRSNSVPDGQGNFSFYLCLSPASGSCTDAYTNSAGFGALPLSFGGSFGRTAYNYGDTTLRLRWETKAAIDNSWLQAAPVPEPASWAMLLGGLTILGATGARRRGNPGRRAERP